jgi:hypothetical protein
MIYAKEEGTMIPVVSTPTHEIPPVAVPQCWEMLADFVETDAQNEGQLPTLACRLNITDLQHWIDLCA